MAREVTPANLTLILPLSIVAHSSRRYRCKNVAVYKWFLRVWEGFIIWQFNIYCQQQQDGGYSVPPVNSQLSSQSAHGLHSSIQTVSAIVSFLCSDDMTCACLLQATKHAMKQLKAAMMQRHTTVKRLGQPMLLACLLLACLLQDPHILLIHDLKCHTMAASK